FIRLNYARGADTLKDAAGSTGGYAGGAPSGSTATTTSVAGISSQGTPVVASQTTTTSSDQGIIPIIRRRLSRRGSVEADGRSNTLIITDVKENIDAIRQLVSLLDQPEPQVEIETRIVIANKSFSRDLGVQLNALALNTTTGGTAGFSTAPGSPLAGASGGSGNTIGLRPAGI